MKEKRFNRRTEKMEKQAIQYMQENEKLERHVTELQESHSTETRESIIKNDDTSQKKGICYESPVILKEKEKSRNKDKSKKTLIMKPTSR